ncbi:hypothetical protein SMICM304S_06328 [Streptomyces microflavus]
MASLKKPLTRPSTIFGRAASGLPSARVVLLGDAALGLDDLGRNVLAGEVLRGEGGDVLRDALGQVGVGLVQLDQDTDLRGQVGHGAVHVHGDEVAGELREAVQDDLLAEVGVGLVHVRLDGLAGLDLGKVEPPAGPYGPGHRGVDLGARPGSEVLAAATGRVSFAGRVAGRGVLVIELAGSGAPPLRTTYEPVRALVAKGDDVVAGRPVGMLEAGPFHCAAGCLHWGCGATPIWTRSRCCHPRFCGAARHGCCRLRVPEPGAAAAPVAAALSRVRRAGSSRRRCPR